MPPAAFDEGLACHNDLNLDNVIFRNGQAVALIDFDLASPGSVGLGRGRRRSALGAVAPRPLHPRRPTRPGRWTRLRTFVEAYGPPELDAEHLVWAVRLNHDWMYRLIEDGAKDGNVGFADYWRQAARRVAATRTWYDGPRTPSWSAPSPRRNAPHARGQGPQSSAAAIRVVVADGGGVALVDHGRGLQVGARSGRPVPTCGTGQAGSSPVSAQAACRAAPTATLSATSVTVTGRPNTAGAICCTAADFAAPPVRIDPLDRSAMLLQHPQAVGQAPQDALDRGPGEIGRHQVGQRQPDQLAGRRGQRRRPLPLQVGHEGQPLAARRGAEGQPGELGEVDVQQRAVADRFRAAFSVQTSGRNAPVASAKPATVPVGSWVWCGLVVKAVPLVPSETTAVPGGQPEAEARRHVVSGARSEPDAVRRLADHGVRGGHRGSRRS